MPLAKSLEILVKQEQDEDLRQTVVEIKKMIESGLSFSRSLSKSRCRFPRSYVAVVQAGENSGTLVRCLDNMNLYLEKESALIRRVKSALVYPIFTLSISLLLIIAIVRFVFPLFMKMFAQTRATLPLLTRVVMRLMQLSQSPLTWGVGMIIVALLIYGTRIRPPSEAWKERMDRFKLGFPVVGKFYAKVALTQFCRVLAALYANGVPIRQCLLLSADVVENKVFENEIRRVEQDLVQGKKIYESLKAGGQFPEAVVQMMAVGEDIGDLGIVLNDISDYYDLEIDAALQTLTALIEPFIIVFLGIVMGTFMISVFLPLYQLINGFNR